MISSKGTLPVSQSRFRTGRRQLRWATVPLPADRVGNSPLRTGRWAGCAGLRLNLGFAWLQVRLGDPAASLGCRRASLSLATSASHCLSGGMWNGLTEGAQGAIFATSPRHTPESPTRTTEDNSGVSWYFMVNQVTEVLAMV